MPRSARSFVRPSHAALPLVLAGFVTMTGCWKLETAELPEDAVAFTPETPTTAEDWTVTSLEMDLECPDGEDVRFYVVHPVEPAGPLPAAVVYHSGSFDYVPAPVPGNPLAGDHFQDPPRLRGPWSIRMAFSTLGMYPEPLVGESHEGALPAALADEGVAMVLPVNCWGDFWHNEPGAVDNDFEADLFFRTGRVSAEWAFRLLSDPAFGEAIGATLPFEPDPDRLYAIGLGEGGRAVGEILALDYAPRAIAVDSMIDDLSLLPEAQPATTPGLQRIFGDDFTGGSLTAIDALPPTAFIYSPVDAVIPSGSNDAILARLEGNERHQIFEGTAALHVLSNSDPDLARDVVDFLLAAE
jgi:hypothetical protein